MALSRTTPLVEARALFGQDLLGPEEVGRALATDPTALAASDPGLISSVPYELATLQAARARGEMLIFRVPSDGRGPLTTLRLHERFPDSIQAKLMQGVGYQLKDEWTLDQEPFAATATCRLEWRLVHPAPISTTCNLSYELQDEALARYASTIGLDGQLRRRSAVEILYDTILCAQVTRRRLLERAWDWSDTPTADGGQVTVGEFAPGGLYVIGYSRAVRFGTLGVCAQH